ncbi:sensor histidine kinase [Actinomadura rayongensis]|uniref:histidine kinase n=1 Tax=Actinomadura rayongensis TaxID=1429076 RepID=A0A6I4W3A5_9ACTN|nr:histidine kinase [Actinomadura rayongensis]MXQ63160.1 two-component sensor histidine kinase [Actinomadura rayongensis]
MSVPGVVEPSGLLRLKAALRARPLAADALLAGAVLALTLVRPLVMPEAGRLTVHGVLLGTVICAALVVRRVWPVLTLAVTTSGMACYLANGGLKSPLMVTTMIALYTIALYRGRRAGCIAAAAVSAVLAGTSAIFGNPWWLGPEILALLAQSALAAAIGDAVRHGRAYVGAIKERARRAEETREEEARRRVIDERLRIARELHDVLAHHVSLINVQAGVAAHVLESDPAQARESLAHIRRAARASLDEVRATIGLLRQPDTAEAPDAPEEPSPGLARLPDLVASFTAAGMVVDQSVTGVPADLPSAVDLTAFRIVQEALTNVGKHAARPYADLRLDYRTDELRLTVTSPSEPGEPGEPGHGMVGMRERAHALGGTFSAGRAAGRFRVAATLPHPGSGR